MRALDITGETLGGCEAISATDERHGSSVVWRFRCECGAEFRRALAHAKRTEENGGRLMCDACLAIFRGDKARRWGLRDLWDTCGSLYSGEGEDIPDTFATACPREDY